MPTITIKQQVSDIKFRGPQALVIIKDDALNTAKISPAKKFLIVKTRNRKITIS